jgi:hypothetical protein
VSALYLYAITDRPGAPLPPVQGLEDAPLQTCEYEDVAAVYSVNGSSEIEASEAALWQHEAVAEALMRDRAVLPVRFGVAFSGEPALRASLSRRHGQLAEALDRVRGRVEIGLRVRWAPAGAVRSTAADGAGRAYLQARLEERRRGEELADALHRPLAALAADSRHTVLETPRLLLGAAYLVEADQVSAFRAQVDALAAEHPDLGFACTGPWPAYNFSHIELGAP